MERTMPEANKTVSIRRALLASAALVAPAMLLPALAAAAVENVTSAPALPEADARSSRRCRRLKAVGGDLDVPHDPVARAAVDEVHACIGEIGRLPASTPAGLPVKARIVRDEVMVG